MRKTTLFLATLALGAVGRDGQTRAQPREGDLEVARVAPAKSTASPLTSEHASSPAGQPGKRLFLDVHALGPGKVTPEAAAGAHKKDLATEGKYGVDFKAYWVDQKQGKIYCLAEAPSAEAINLVHRDAHGLLAEKVAPVSGDAPSWSPAPGAKLFMDVHHLDASKVTAQAVAAAHQKDLAAQAKHNVKYLNYWFDADTGTVMCLSEAPSARAALAVHKDAHGLMPDSIEQVSEGR